MSDWGSGSGKSAKKTGGKGVVRAYTRKSKSGKSVSVKSYSRFSKTGAKDVSGHNKGKGKKVGGITYETRKYPKSIVNTKRSGQQNRAKKDAFDQYGSSKKSIGQIREILSYRGLGTNGVSGNNTRFGK